VRLLWISLLSLSACSPSSDFASFKTTPIEIHLQIVALEEFRDTYGRDAEGAAFFNEQPCRIVLPDGMVIEYTHDPTIWYPRARFKDRYSGDTFAHELTHCFQGHWHSS
jgi:hypothetical protein